MSHIELMLKLKILTDEKRYLEAIQVLKDNKNIFLTSIRQNLLTYHSRLIELYILSNTDIQEVISTINDIMNDSRYDNIYFPLDFIPVIKRFVAYYLNNQSNSTRDDLIDKIDLYFSERILDEDVKNDFKIYIANEVKNRYLENI
jgi:hypothetical protein